MNLNFDSSNGQEQTKPVEPSKGQKHGECNRTACHNPNALWFNKSTRAFYCQPCAFRIMEWPENKGLLERHEPDVQCVTIIRRRMTLAQCEVMRKKAHKMVQDVKKYCKRKGINDTRSTNS